MITFFNANQLKNRSYILLLLLLFWGHLGHSQTAFIDVTASVDLQTNEGAEGIAIGDFNNDGYDDFYVSHVIGSNQLYKNNGDGTFIEIGGELGLALGATIDTRTAVWGDINNDGWQDLYVGNKGTLDKLFLNLGNDNFEEISTSAGIQQLGHPKSVNMADVNQDGFLDIYISNFAGENVLYLNNGDKTFTDYTLTAGALDRGRAMGSIFFDYDKDGDVDLYLVHDGNEPNFLYQNDGTGIFTEVGQVAGVNTASFGMGVDVGDINNDGWLDIYITNFGPNFLLLNNGDGTFRDISKTAEVDQTGMGWGTNFIDFDKDGLLDIYVANDTDFGGGFHPNVLYRNKGNLTFESSEINGAICNKMSSYGAAQTDFNLDGNLDMLVVNREEGEGVTLYQNPERENHWLGFKLVGINSNRNAFGAKITVLDNLGVLHYKELLAGHSWESQSSQIIQFGLGNATEIESMTIDWPSGDSETVQLSEIDKYYTITEGGLIEEGLFGDRSTSTVDILPTPFELSIFPNPNNGNFTINFKATTAEPLLVEIFDILGKNVFHQEITSPIIGDNQIKIQQVNNLTFKNKLLFVRLSNQDGWMASRKILVD